MPSLTRSVYLSFFILFVIYGVLRTRFALYPAFREPFSH